MATAMSLPLLPTHAHMRFGKTAGAPPLATPDRPRRSLREIPLSKEESEKSTTAREGRRREAPPADWR